MSGRPTRAAVERWADEVDAVGERIGRRFARSEPRRRAVGYIRGLLGDAERKNGWQVAEHLGEATPDGVQHLLARADWDADAVRDDRLGYVGEHLGDSDGVLIVDQTGFVKKGTKSCGVARQYTGTAGRVENAQVGVFLGYSARRGRALVDRALYLPREWAADARRRTGAGVPGEVAFATKIVLARRMIDRAVATGVPARWVTADAVYGSDSHFRATAEAARVGVRGRGAVGLRGVGGVPSGAGDGRARRGAGDAWERLSCGDGAKGPRVSDWALVRANSPDPAAYARWVLIRRSVSDPTEVAYLACGGPPDTTLQQVVLVAGARWAIEDLFALAKGECGLDEYEVRSWTGWHRHVTLSLWALAVVAVIRSRVPAPRRKKGASG